LAALGGGAIDLEFWVIDRLTSLFEEEDVLAGQRVYAEGEHSEFIYFSREGRLRMVRQGHPSWTFEGRRVFGVFDMVIGRPHNRTAIALTDLHLLRLRAEHWLELLEDSFDVVRVGIGNSARITAGLEARRWATQAEPRGMAVATVPAALNSPLSFVDRLAIVATIDMLRSAGVQVLADLVGMMEERELEPGEVIYRRGRPASDTFLLLGGQVVAERSDPDIKVLFGPGSMIGGTASFGEPILGWEARALSKTRVLAMRLEDWYDTMEEHFDLARSALATLALQQEAILDDLAAETGDILLK
jgi:CRP-like cAMP-binding protein